MKRNTKAMENYNHRRGDETRERVLKAIDFCKEQGEISVTLVCEKAHISRTYFTNHPDVRKVLDDAIGITNSKREGNPKIARMLLTKLFIRRLKKCKNKLSNIKKKNLTKISTKRNVLKMNL